MPGAQGSLTRTEAQSVDGRRLEVVMAGEPTRGTVIVHHGTPGVAALFALIVGEGVARGLRHVAYSRPGYGRSERLEGRSVADCASDVAAVADSLDLEHFYTVGWSGGGPHVLACAALLEDRVLAAASVAGVAPSDAEGLDWSQGMGRENLEEFAAAEAGAQELTAYLEAEHEAMSAASVEQLHAALGDLLSDVDRAALSGAYAEHLAVTMRAALAPGVQGWLDDDLAFMRSWGFDLGTIRVPVSVWQGGQDRFVPPSHGEWLAEHVSGARARMRPSDGHLSLTLGAYGDVLDDLLESRAG